MCANKDGSKWATIPANYCEKLVEGHLKYFVKIKLSNQQFDQILQKCPAVSLKKETKI